MACYPFVVVVWDCVWEADKTLPAHNTSVRNAPRTTCPRQPLSKIKCPLGFEKRKFQAISNLLSK